VSCIALDAIARLDGHAFPNNVGDTRSRLLYQQRINVNGGHKVRIADKHR
jgi:hypothetical protein